MEIDIDIDQIRKESLDLLGDFQVIMDRHGIPFWLDQGTVLGVCRDNDFIPWDNDIDICVWKDDLMGKPEVFNDLRKAGFRLFFMLRAETIRIERIDEKTGWRSLDLVYYVREGDKAVKHFQVYSRPKIRGFLNHISLLLDAILEFKRGPDLRYKNIQDQLLMIRQSPAKINVETAYEQRSVWGKTVIRWVSHILPLAFISWVKHILSQFKHYYCIEIFRLETPAHFFEDFEVKDFRGLQVRLPKPALDYVRFKFGDNWRTPRKEWIYYEEDGAVKAVNLPASVKS